MAFIRGLMISLFVVCFAVDSAELLLHFEKETDRLLVVVVNEKDEPLSVDQGSFRISSLGQLHFEFKKNNGGSFNLVALVNDRSAPSITTLEFGDAAGRFFYLRHLLADYGVIDQGKYTVTAFMCDRNNAAYDDELLKRDGETCLISNQVEFDK